MQVLLLSNLAASGQRIVQDLILANAAVSSRVDPYLKWALLTNFSGFRLHRGKIPFACELADLQQNSTSPATWNAAGLVVHSGYLNGGGAIASPFFTGLAQVSDLASLHEHAQQAGARLKMGLPGSIPSFNRGGQAGMGGGGPGPKIGIIDHAIGFLNSAFHNKNGATRVIGFWDQDVHTNPKPAACPLASNPANGFEYGVVIEGSAIDRAVRVTKSNPIAEERTYNAIGYQPARAQVGHGTHVLGLAAGRFDRGLSGRPGGILTDPASDAEILAVQLPWRPYKDTSGGSLCVHVLDALRWMCNQESQAIIVNISDGAYAGPGDGRSLLERAMLSLVTERIIAGDYTLQLVIAAGNGAKRQGHATGTINAGLASKPIFLHVLPDVLTDSFVECWIDCANPPNSNSWMNDVSLELKLPDGSTTLSAALPNSNNPTVVVDAGGRIVGMVHATDQSPDCPDRLGFLIALAPTRGEASIARGVMPHGIFQINVHNGTQSAIEFSLCIQRSNPALGEIGGVREPVFLLDRSSGYVTQKETINNIASSNRHAIVVGGCYAGSSRQSWPLPSTPTLRENQVDYSSRGRAIGVLAPSDESPMLPGLLSEGNRSGSVVRMNGTSVSAPQVTRLLFNEIKNGAQTPINLSPPQVAGRLSTNPLLPKLKQTP